MLSIIHHHHIITITIISISMTMPTAITITRMHCFSLHSPNHLSLPPLSLALPPSTRTRFFKGSSILTRSFNADASFGTDSRLQGEGNNGFGNLPKSGGTRLSRVLQTQQKQLRLKFDEVRRNLPLKVFLVLLGFYSANALATILGQTGDWDVLVAGIAVAIIEILGSLLYRKPSVSSRFQNLLRLVNYWKAGFTLGLFVDAFKVGS